MSLKIKNFLISFIAFLLLLAWWSSLTVGLSTDEYFHHINGLVRFEYLKTFGEFKDFQFRNNEFYPGLYDTLSYGIGQFILLINKNFYSNNIDLVMHFVNISFSSFSILGLYLFTKKIFNTNIAILTSLLTLLNPFFFGHMGMNSKDLIVFFSLIWFCYYFYLYCTEDEKIFKNLILSSFFIGFGCGVRLTFLVVIFPAIICGLVFLFKKYGSKFEYLIKRLLFHSLITIVIALFFIVLCWPHLIEEIQNGNFVDFFSLIIKNTINWNDGPKLGLINNEYYEVFNTPKMYFGNIIIYRLPFYLTLLIAASYFLIFTKKLMIKKQIKGFYEKFLIINFISFFPILLALILSVNIYDNLRLFLFVIPFFSLIASFSIDQFLNSFKNSFNSKIFLTIIVILFSFSFYRFILLTPYQYGYVNHSSLKNKDNNEKWEHDYWGASYKELVLKIKKKYSKEEIKKFKITNCSGDETLLYYLTKELGIKKLYRGKEEFEANYVVLINRTTLDIFNPKIYPEINHLVDRKGVMLLKDMEFVVRFPGIKTTCFKQYKGTDEVTVSRNGVVLSALRKWVK
ncbi:glycosyltransferase family 39 protein [Candidatus Pelagibacter sp.]|nr:glycosyltransferase family 39 protein [Candidatus Pelagibacter sp.]